MNSVNVNKVITLLKSYKSLYSTDLFDTMINTLIAGNHDIGFLSQGYDYMGRHILIESDFDSLDTAWKEMINS